MHEIRQAVVLDAGPLFIGWSARVRGVPVCVMTPKVFSDAATRQLARELFRRQGTDCGTCRNCPVGQAR